MGTYYKAGKFFIGFGYNVCDLRIYVLYLYGSDNSALCSNLKSWIVYHVVSASHKNNSKCCTRHENKQYTVVTASEKDQVEVKFMYPKTFLTFLFNDKQIPISKCNLCKYINHYPNVQSIIKNSHNTHYNYTYITAFNNYNTHIYMLLNKINKGNTKIKHPRYQLRKCSS